MSLPIIKLYGERFFQNLSLIIVVISEGEYGKGLAPIESAILPD